MSTEPFEKIVGHLVIDPTKKDRVKEQRFVAPMAPIDSLINEAQRRLGLRTKTEAILAVGSTPIMIHRIRSGQIRATPEFILKFYDVTGMSIEEIRFIAKLPKTI